MFDSLGKRLADVFDRLKGRGHLTEKDVTEAMREVRMALLEADVALPVVKEFISTVRERAVGKEVLESLTPGQQVVGIVNEEMTKLLGGTATKLVLAGKPPVVVMLVGLQGSGKTTAAGKLAVLLRRIIEGHLFGVSALDPGVIGLVLAVLAVVALAACVVPARRATRIEPVRALTQE